jgi:hypothetical protein
VSPDYNELDPNGGPDPEALKRVGPGAQLVVADLRRADLSGADLSGAHLAKANLAKANLRASNLRASDLSGADLSLADLRASDLSGANLRDANLSLANLSGANLSEADLSGANLFGANLWGVDPTRSNWEGANLSDSRGFYFLSRTRVANAIFSPRSPDAWSVLRRKYTGVMVAFHLLLATTALAPYLLRTLLPYVDEESKGLPRYALLLGSPEGPLVVASSFVLIAYNLARLGLTWWLSQLREEEVRSRVSPAKKHYVRFWYVHNYFMAWIESVAIAFAIWRTARWLLDTPVG